MEFLSQTEGITANSITTEDGATVEEKIEQLKADVNAFGRQIKQNQGTILYQPILADLFAAINPNTISVSNDNTLINGSDTSLKLTVTATANIQYRAYMQANIKIIDNTKPLQLWVHIPITDYSKIKNVSCEVGIDYKYNVYPPDVKYSAIGAIEYRQVGWNLYTMDVSAVPNNTILKYLYFGILCNADCTPIIHIGAFKQGYKITSPKIVFTFDNCGSNLYTNIYPILKEYGYKGSFAWQSNTVPGGYGALTMAQHKELIADGWDYAMYTSAANMATYQTALKAAGLDPRFFFCPKNASSELILTTLKSLNFLLCRNRWWHTPYLQYADNTTLEITCNGLKDDVAASTDDKLANDIALVDLAISNGGIICICMHAVLSTAGSDGLSTQDTTFRAFLDYVKSKADIGQIEVITFGQLYDSIYSDSCPTYPSTIGDRKYSDNPATSGFIGWVYTKSGWKGFGTIS